MVNGIQQHQMQAFFTTTSAAIENNNGKTLPLSAAGTGGSPSSSSVVTHLETAEYLSGIAKKYDVRHMSPREMSAMSHELYQGGAISFQDHALLSFQPELGADVPGVTGQADTPKDFIAHWEQQLKVHEALGDITSAQHDRKMLNILGNVEAISS